MPVAGLRRSMSCARFAERDAHTESAHAGSAIAMIPASGSAHLKSASVCVVGARLGERGLSFQSAAERLP